MMNLPKLQALIAPFATPTGPAMFLSNEFYKASIAAGVPNWIGLFIAITTIVGVEFSGALMCYCAIEAWQRQSWGKMWLAIIGATIYGLIMFIGFSSLDEQKARIFGIMVLLTLVAYLGYAIYHSFGSQEEFKKLTIQEINAKTRQTNAEARKLKVERQVPASSGNLPAKTGRPSWLGKVPETKEDFIAYCNSGVIVLPEKITSTELSKYVPVSERTVRNWLAEIKR